MLNNCYGNRIFLDNGMTFTKDCYRIIHSILSKKPSRFGWVIKGKLVASGRIMNSLQLVWAKKHGIKCVITMKDRPLSKKWFSQECGIDNKKYVEVEDYGAPPLA